MKKSLKYLCFCIVTIVCLSCNGSVLDSPVPKSVAGYCLTFDDRYVTQWGSIKTLLDSNNVHATFFITDVSKLTSKEIDIVHSLQDYGNEIGCHSLKHLDALEYLTKHSVQEYIDSEVRPAVENFYKINIFPTAFSYPYGSTTDSLNASVLNYFRMLRTIAEEQRTGQVDNVETVESVFDKFNEKRIIAALDIDFRFKISLAMIQQALYRAKNRNEIVIFYAHCPVDKVYSASAYQVEKSFLRELFKMANEMGMKNYRFSELVE